MSDSATNEQTRVIGQVKWFNTKTGYGFITAREGEHDGKDIFTHFSSVQVNDSQYKYLVQGEYVELSIVKSTTGQHEYQSANVTGIKGGSIMCEIRQQNVQGDRRPPSSGKKYKTRAPNDETEA
jgi:CspA family cold shock protein